MASSFTALYIAYSIVWAGVFAYIVYMHLRQRSIQRDIIMLREAVKKHGG
jgi:CcmD family protein